MGTMDMAGGPVPPAGELNLWQRIWNTWISPSRVFAQLRERPRLLGILIVLVVLSAAAGMATTGPLTKDQEKRLNANERLTEEQRAQAQGQAQIWLKLTPIFAVGGNLAVVFVMAGVLLFLGNLLLGGRGTYRTLAAATAHAGMISIPELVVKVPLMLSKGTMEVSTSLAALLPEESKRTFLWFVLAQTDIFALWRLWLSVLIVAVVSGVPRRKAATGVIGAWVIWSLIWAPLQAFLARMQGGGMGGG